MEESKIVILLSNDETNALFDVVTDYTYALDDYDNGILYRADGSKRL